MIDVEIRLDPRDSRQLEALLVELAREYASKKVPLPVGRAFRTVSKPILDDITANAPVDTGRLRNSTRRSTVRNNRGYMHLIGFRSKASNPIRQSNLLGLEYGNLRINEPTALLQQMALKYATHVGTRLPEEMKIEIEKDAVRRGRAKGFKARR